MKLLQEMCLDRGEPMDEIRLQRYSKALERFPDAAIGKALDQLADSKRGEFEPRIPIKGELIEMVQKEAHRADRPPDCAICDNRRLVMGEKGGERVAKRCQCFIEWKARVEQGVGGSNP
jgi:hypothetical protein